MIDSQIKKAEQGREFWLTLEKKYSVGQSILLIYLCHKDDDLNEIALSNLDKLIKHRNAKGAVVISHYESIDLNIENVIIEKISNEQGENLIKFYELYQFTDYFYIVSLEKPCGSKLKNLMKNENIDKETILKQCIYQLK